jgi:hypothetical protein
MAARPFNPNRPCVIGPEWAPVVDFGVPILSLNAYGSRLTASTNDTIDGLYTAVLDAIPKSTELAVSVFDITNGGAPAFPQLDPEESVTFYPSSDFGGISNGVWTYGYNAGSVAGPGAAARYSYVDSTSLTPGFFNGQIVGSSKFLFSVSGGNFDAAFQVGGVAGSTVGRWITRVQARMTVSCTGGTGGAGPGNIGIWPYIVVGGITYWGSPQAVPSTSPESVVTADWFVHPRTGLPWTDSDIAGFDSSLFGSSNAVGFVAIGVGNTSSYAIVEQVQLVVFSSANDPRLAIGTVAINRQSPLGQGWGFCQFRTKTTGAPTSFTLVAGHTYLFELQETREPGGALGINSLQGRSAAPGPPFWDVSNIDLDPVSHRPLQVLAPGGALPPIILRKSGGGLSADSQPYAWCTQVQGGATGFQFGVPNGTYHFSEVSFGQWMRQQFTVDTPTTFGHLGLICSLLTTSTDDPATPLSIAEPMVINIKRQSDDALMAGPFTVHNSDLASPVTGWQTVSIDIGAVALAAGQFYLEATSAANPYACWQVQVAITGIGTPPSGPPSGTGALTWGGGVDSLIVYHYGVPTTYVAETALFSLGERPAAPSNFNAIAMGESACHIDAVSITWSPVVLTCGVHGAYEIERSDNGGAYRKIASITSASVHSFIDYESVRNAPASYRMRLVRVDGTPSPWTAIKVATATLRTCGLLFVSNEQPSLNVFYPDDQQVRKFLFPQRVTVNAPFGRQYQIVLHNLEYQGRTWLTQVAVRAGVDGCTPQFVTCDDITLTGASVFDPLQSICRADLSYVCLHNEHGDRMFSSCTAPSGEWVPTNVEVFTQDLEVVEITDIPSTPDVAPPSS